MKRAIRLLAIGVTVGAFHVCGIAAATEGELIVYSYNDAKAEADREAGKLSWSDYYRASLLSFSRTRTERSEAFKDRFRALIEVSVARESGAITAQQFDEIREQINAEANQIEQQYWAGRKAQEDRDLMRIFAQSLAGAARANAEATRRNAEAARAARPVVCDSQALMGSIQTICR